MNFLGYKIDFSNLPLDIFLFYFLLSILVWWIAHRYFKNKIAVLTAENESLKYELAVKESKKEEELTVPPPINYYKNEYKFDAQHQQDSESVEADKLKLAVTTLFPDCELESSIEQKVGIVSENTDEDALSATINEVSSTSEIDQKVIEPLPISDEKKEIILQLLPINQVLNFSKTHPHHPQIEDEPLIENQSTEISIDDLKLVEGIGFKIQEILNYNGIFNFKQLSELAPSTIKGYLEAAGSRFAMHDPSTWPKQAELAKDGEWPALRRLQDELDKGKIVK